jgi:hypothetical protein
MAQTPGRAQIYLCPMHSDVRQQSPGKCPKCGMDLIAEGTRFGLLRHMFGSPLHLAIMGAVMIVIMVTFMMLR